MVIIGSTRVDIWQSNADVQTTDDAYIRADISRLGARVAGTVTRVAVGDFEAVKAGQLLVELDPQEFLAKRWQARAAVDFAVAQLVNLDNQTRLQQALLEQAEAQKAVAATNASLAEKEAARQNSLVTSGSTTLQKAEQAQAQARSATASAQAADAAVKSAQAQLDVIEGQAPQLTANVEAAKSQLKTAELALSYTRITAPIDGVVSERQLHVGDFVTIGTNAVTLVPLPQVHVIANFKETQLGRMRDGQPASIRIDALPGLVFSGRVTRLAPASGSQFALMPADNATGNFTKVVQRVSVRVDLDKGQALSRLLPGMSATVQVSVSETK
jgi:membrane fusion protein (multidrug efflux system)